MSLRLAEPHERRPVLCGARRRPGGVLTCTMPALHLLGFHSAQDRAWRWHFWEGPR